MIEDDDKFKQKENLDVAYERNFIRPIIILFILIIWCVGLSIFFYPKVKSAVIESGVLELIADMNEEVLRLFIFLKLVQRFIPL